MHFRACALCFKATESETEKLVVLNSKIQKGCRDVSNFLQTQERRPRSGFAAFEVIKAASPVVRPAY